MKRYLELLQDIRTNGKTKKDRTGTGIVYQFGQRFRHDLRDGFPLLTTKKINPLKPFAEIFAFLKGASSIDEFNELECNIWDPWGLSDDISYKKEMAVADVMKLLFNKCYGKADFTEEQLMDEFYNREREIRNYDYKVKQLPANLSVPNNRIKFMMNNPRPVSYIKLAEQIGINTKDKILNFKKGYLGPIYGVQWTNWNGEGVNQIKTLIKSLKENPNSRRHVVTGWNPSVVPDVDYKNNPITEEPLTSSKEKVDAAILDGKQALPPCHMFMIFDVDTSESKHVLNLHMVMRSCDVPVGLPFNIAGYAFLLKLVAKQVNMVAGELLIDITNAHIYQDQLDLVDTQLNRAPYQLPELTIPDGIDITDSDTLTLENLKRCIDGLTNYHHHSFIKYPVSV